MIDAGKRYYGEFDAQRFVMSVDKKTVTYQLPKSLAIVTCSVKEFTDWMKGSQRRTYHSPDGRRVRLGPAYDQPMLNDDGTDAGETEKVISFIQPDADGNAITTVPEVEWLEWRNSLPA